MDQKGFKLDQKGFKSLIAHHFSPNQCNIRYIQLLASLQIGKNPILLHNNELVDPLVSFFYCTAEMHCKILEKKTSTK